jgi:tetratricopeptide (TPR) repeat protein
VQLLDFSPTDSEAWSELSDIYLSQGLYPQAIYAAEEILVLAPNAWNVCSPTIARSLSPMLMHLFQIHARLGELQYMAATTSGVAGGSYQKYMAEALKRFSRSIELCDDYLRGYYGLKLVRPSLSGGEMSADVPQISKKLLDDGAKAVKQADDSEFALPDTSTIERLNELATAKLSEIVRHSAANDRGWRGYSEAEVAAARELLAEDVSAVER